MPRVVDHGQRRGEIAEALWRVAAAEGLEAVSLARVAEEAGISKGRVQHYFASRDELLDFAAQQLQLRVDGRVRARMAAAAPSSPLGRSAPC
nr:TetR family transcriptional regulator [Pseudonocardia sp. AL041005-10]